jgi:Cys-rich protein (TIGR01571 family)
MFAGALVASSQFGPEIDAADYALRGRRLQDTGTSSFASVTTDTAATASDTAVQDSDTPDLPAADPVAPADPIVTPAPAAPAAPVATVVAAAATVAPTVVETTCTTVSVATLLGAAILPVVASQPFVVGHKIIIDAGLTTQEVNRVHALADGELTMKTPLLFAHNGGAKVCIEEESLHQMSLHQSSSGSSGSLKSSDSSSGSFARSSNSLKSSSSGSEDNLLKSGSTSSVGASSGSGLLNFLLMVCFACVYKGKVVDPMGKMPKQSLQYESPDDFRYGLFDCVKDCNMCLMVTCCPLVRIAHTNETADVCGFWETLCCLGLSTILCGMGPCCLNVYFRIHIKDHMGIQDHCFNDMVLAWCCLPCITGQQALAVDEVMGFTFKCPCTVERSGMSGGYGGENQALNWS